MGGVQCKKGAAEIGEKERRRGKERGGWGEREGVGGGVLLTLEVGGNSFLNKPDMFFLANEVGLF